MWEPEQVCFLEFNIVLNLNITLNVAVKSVMFASAYEELLSEISRREKSAGIVPDPDIDTYMKVYKLCQ